MKVLVACEFSGIVREAFAKKGHDVMSCDLLPTEQPGNHYQGDVRDILDEGWDLMIAHPPCTHLAVSGARWFKNKQVEQKEAIDFFMCLVNAPIERIAIENPVSIMSTHYRKPDQIIQPWMFGHEATKTTCLWLKHLPILRPTTVVGKGKRHITKSGKSLPDWYNIPPIEGRSKMRSITFTGIAEAMAEQWG
ncbi:MAG: hypothetical protein PHR29_05155 [Acholeplasmataceae bacterium]|nr:hypothetical protein [Acholeplasmataceae bacterium]